MMIWNPMFQRLRIHHVAQVNHKQLSLDTCAAEAPYAAARVVSPSTMSAERNAG